MSFTVLPKTSGMRFLGLCFQWATMFVMVSVGVVSGLGPYITRGSSAATAQVLTVALVKISWAMVMLYFRPCACGLTNAMIVTQFTLEGSSSLMLLLGGANGADPEQMRQISFAMLLIPVFVPIVQKAYDAIFVNIIVNCVRKKFNPQAALGTLIIMFLALPAFVARFTGFQAPQFNVASLSRTVNASIASIKNTITGTKKSKKTVHGSMRRIVRKEVRKEEETEKRRSSVGMGFMGYPAGALGTGVEGLMEMGAGRVASTRRMAEDEEGADDDGGGGGGDD